MEKHANISFNKVSAKYDWVARKQTVRLIHSVTLNHTYQRGLYIVPLLLLPLNHFLNITLVFNCISR